MTVDLTAPPTLPQWAWRTAGRLGLRLARVCRCQDCLADVQQTAEWYMVHDHVWAQAGTCARGGYLCIGCLEHRIGRQLSGADFTGAPVNRAAHWGGRGHLPIRRSARFNDRLDRGPLPRAPSTDPCLATSPAGAADAAHNPHTGAPVPPHTPRENPPAP